MKDHAHESQQRVDWVSVGLVVMVVIGAAMVLAPMVLSR